MPDCLEIINGLYTPGTGLHRTLVEHGKRVADKALRVADRLKVENPDREFIRESAMLHDIGMVFTNVARLGCRGNHPYIAHGILGRAVLEKAGLPEHAMVCERHVGVGLTRQDILIQKLPLPLRDMTPVTLEETIVCYADKFFSKSREPAKEKTLVEILENLARFGRDKADIFLSWAKRFERPEDLATTFHF